MPAAGSGSSARGSTFAVEGFAISPGGAIVGRESGVVAFGAVPFGIAGVAVAGFMLSRSVFVSTTSGAAKNGIVGVG